MKVSFLRHELRLQAENDLETAYIEDTLGLDTRSSRATAENYYTDGDRAEVAIGNVDNMCNDLDELRPFLEAYIASSFCEADLEDLRALVERLIADKQSGGVVAIPADEGGKVEDDGYVTVHDTSEYPAVDGSVEAEDTIRTPVSLGD